MQPSSLSTSSSRTSVTTPESVASVAGGAGLAHDAVNLLSALGLYCDLLETPGVLQPQHKHYATEVRLLAQRSSVLIERLLERLMVVSEAPLESVRSESVLRAFQPVLHSLAAPDIPLQISIQPGLPALPFAAEILERILVNLTRNAAAAVRANAGSSSLDGAPHIGIALSGTPSHLCLSVSDTGTGMKPEVVAAFLQPGLPETERIRGLGHLVVHELVQSTNGQLSISTRAGRGTTLQIDWVMPGVVQDA
jgi:signal transduction histidine kinase